MPVNWLTIWHSVTSMSPMSTANPSSSGTISTATVAEPDLAGERMIAAEAALHRVGEAEQKALVATRQRLQADVAVGRKVTGSRVRSNGLGSPAVGASASSKPFVDPGCPARAACARSSGSAASAARGAWLAPQSSSACEIEQAVRVVVGRAKHLPAGQILVGRGDPPADRHRRRVDRHARSRSVAASCDRRAAGTPPRWHRLAPASRPARRDRDHRASPRS